MSDALCAQNGCAPAAGPSTPLPPLRLRLAPRLEAASLSELAGSSGAFELHWPPRNQSEFLTAVVPHARRAAQAIGVSEHALVAQAALESGWGRRLLRGRDGKPGFNLFGIKADPEWDGHRIRVSTREYVGGRLSRRPAEFRVYRNLAEAFDDYVAFLRRNPRYAEALRHAADGHRFARRLQTAGYSTDPHYAEKIRRIATGRALRRALAAHAQSATAAARPEAEIAAFGLKAESRMGTRSGSGLLLAPRD